MKKHIFGFALFSLIVATFAIIYAFFSAPSIPPVNAVKPPSAVSESRTEKPYSCPTKRKDFAKDFSYEIVSANYFAEQNKLVTKVKLYWNGSGVAPKKLVIQPRIFTIESYDNEKLDGLKAETLVEPFADGNGKTFSIESKFVLSGMGSGPPNLYVAFDFADGANGNPLTSEKASLAEAFHVLYVYDDSLVVKPKISYLEKVEK